MTKSQRPTLHDVAKQAGVSPATVSRVLVRPEIVRPSTRSRVAHVIDQLRYRPNGLARALAGGRSRTIGFVVPTLDNAIFSRALQSMQTTLAQAGYHLQVSSSDYSLAAEAEAIRALLEGGIDAIVLVGAMRAPAADELLRNARIPVIVTWVEDEHWPSIVVDNERAGFLAAEHLLQLGHRRLGLISLPLRNNDRQQKRVEGAKRALSRAGIALPMAYLQERPPVIAGGRAGCAALLKLQEPPTAIIGCVDYQAVGAMLEVQEQGLRVPEDVSIVGIDNLELGEHLSPPLTTVHVPTAIIGERAALQIIGRIEGRTLPRRDEVAIELTVRKSTGQVRRE